MGDLDIDLVWGSAAVITVLDTTVSETVAAGRARLTGWSLRATGTQQSYELQGNVTSPGAFSTIVSLNVPAGEWMAAWAVEVSGTVGAPELNNFDIQLGGSPLFTSVNGNAAGVPYQQLPVQVSVPAGGGQLVVKNPNVGTVGATYTATISASPVGTPAIAEITSGGNPVAEIALPLGQAQTVFVGVHGVKLSSDLTLSILSGTFRGAVYAILELSRENS